MRLGIVAVVVMASACGFIGPAANTGTDAPGDDAPPSQLTVGFAAPSSITDEAAGSHKVSVVLSGSSAGAVTVTYRVLDGGTATPNVDFVLMAGTLTFPVDTNQQDIAMEILMDTIDEPDETFTIVLENAEGAALGQAMHHVTISANTVPRVGFASTAMMLSETVTAPGITVRLDKMSTVPIQVDYKVVTAGTTATGAGVDYTLADGTLTIPAATLNATLPLAIVNDALDEDDETIIVVLSNPTNAELDPAATQLTYTILDEDPPPSVQFAAATTAVPEAAGATSVNVTLSAPSGKTITVPYTVTLGTASALDVAVADGTLTFAPGDTTKPVPFAILQDTLDEDDETFTLQLGAPTNATVGTNGAESVTILDDDAPPTISITTANGSVPESVGLVNLTVQLSAVSAKPISVDFAASGTATENADFAYALSPHTLTFSPGTLAQTIAFTVVEDTIDEPDETLITTLANASNATIAGTPQTTTIIDDDPTCFGPPGNYQICIQTVPTTPLTLPAGTLDTTAGSGSPLCAASAPMGWTMNQPDACFIMATTITIPAGTTVKATGPRPLVLLGTDSIVIAGTLDVSSHIGSSSGPASNVGCGAYLVTPGSSAMGGGGGAGGSFMSAGGNGGTGNGAGLTAAGLSLGAQPFLPTVLRGGCDGQHGGGGGGVLSAGTVGHGGGAVYLLAKNGIDLSGGIVNASGSGGTGGDTFSGGSGAGAGGMIEISATTYTNNAATRLLANGGGGAGGADNNSSGGSGADPSTATITTSAIGGTGGGGGNGGKGFAGTTQATSGAAGGGMKGGGGGGGGGGFIQSTVSITGTTLSAGSVDSP